MARRLGSFELHELLAIVDMYRSGEEDMSPETLGYVLGFGS